MLEALYAGIARVLRNPGMLVGLWLMHLVVALPAAFVVGHEIHASIMRNAVHEQLRTGFDMTWYDEFRQTNDGLAETLAPEVAGAGAFFDNVEAWIEGDLFSSEHAGIVALGVASTLLWAFLLGGVVERFVHGRRRGAAIFLRSCGRYGFRFVRLALWSGILYWLVYRLSFWAWRILERRTIDVTSERTVFLGSVLVLGSTALLLVAVHMASTYAKIATVAEGRRSMAFALLHGVGVLLRRPLRSLGLYLAVSMLSAGLVALFMWIGPGSGESGWASLVAALIVSQLLLMLRLGLRLAVVGGQVELARAR